MVDEKVIPHNLSAEKAVLGSCLIDPQAYYRVQNRIGVDDFYLQKNAWVWDAIGTAARNGGIDYVKIVDELERRGQLEEIGGSAYVTHLINAVPNAIYAPVYAGIVENYGRRRRLIRAAEEIVKLAWDTEADRDIDALQAEAEGILVGTRGDTTGNGSAEASEIADRLYEHIDTLRLNPRSKGGIYGLPTGIGALDRTLGGLEPGVYIVAARPGMGKTALMLQMAREICRRGLRVAVFTSEMSEQQVAERLASAMAEVELRALKRGDVTDEDYRRVLEAIAEIADWPLTVIDKAPLRPADVLADLMRLRVEHGKVDVVFIDGLWLMAPNDRRENRTQTLGAISREMKRIQRQLGIPIVMAHQLNRSVEYRADKRPVLADLRDSGDVEQDADIVLFLYRDRYYQHDSPMGDTLELWIAKNRLSGPSGVCAEVWWQGEYMQVCELEHAATPELGLGEDTEPLDF
jgi:replicative DNA helicase